MNEAALTSRDATLPNSPISKHRMRALSVRKGLSMICPKPSSWHDR